MSSLIKTIAPRFDLLLRWLLACLLGSAVGLGLGVLVALGLSRLPWFNQDRGLVYSLLLCLGLALGFFQGRMLADVLPGKNRWLLATLFGSVLGCLVMAVPYPEVTRLPSLFDDAIRLGMVGGAAALAQWWVLRGRYPQAWLWILANVIGYQVFLWMIAYPAASFGELFMSGMMVGTLAALLPGITLAWLADDPPPE